MTAALSAIVPFFGIVLIGYAAARRGLLSEAGLSGLNSFIFNIALPPLLFRVMSHAPDEGFGAGGVGWAYVLAYGVATLAIYALGLLMARSVFALRGPATTLYAHLSANGNVGFLGLPLVVAALGETAALPVAIALTFDVVVVMTVTTLLLEASKPAEDGRRRGAGAAIRAAFLNPIILGALGGVAWGVVGRQALGVELAAPIAQLLDVLGQAAAPAALFAVGATLATKSGDRRVGEISAITITKLTLHPAAVFAAMTLIAPETPSLWIASAILAAACPSSNNAVIFAGVYGVYEARASAAVLVSTALCLISFAAIVTLLL